MLIDWRLIDWKRKEEQTRGSGWSTHAEPSRGCRVPFRRLGSHSSICSMMLSMLLGSFRGMMARVMKMTMSGVSVMCGLLVVSTFVMLCRFLMVMSCLLVVVSCLAVMFG